MRRSRSGPDWFDDVQEENPAKVAEDTAYRNARKHSDRQNARIEHDEALRRVMTAVLNDDMHLFTRISDLAVVLLAIRSVVTPLIVTGFPEKKQATEGDTQWVNYRPSPFSSRSTDF